MEKLKQTFQRVKDFIRGVNPKKRRIFIAVAALVIVISIGTALFLNKKEYNVLFTGLTGEEATEIMGKLQEKGVEYKSQGDGTILVDAKVEEKIRAELVYEGYPKSGFTYDVFKDNIGLMTTDFEKVKYELFELQDRIGATIRLFEGVKDAKVTIALGEERRYVLDANQKTDAKASVVVLMQEDKVLTAKQVNGIKHLVEKSIPDLNISNVSVLDGAGKELSAGDDSQNELTKLKSELEDQIERNIETKVINVLVPFYGEHNVRVSVKANLDINKRIRETINYNFPEWTEKKTVLDAEGNPLLDTDGTPIVTEENQIARGVPSRESINQEFARDAGEGVGGVAGTETNADIPIYGSPALEAQGDENYIINQNDIEYLVNQIKEQVQIDAGVLEDLRVSVSLNNTEVPGLANEQVVDLVGNAAGIAKDQHEQQVTVVAGAFYNPDAPTVQDEDQTLLEQYRIWILGAIIAFVAAILITLIVFMILRKRKKKKLANAVAASSIASEARPRASREEVQIPSAQEKLIDIKNESTVQLRDQIRDFASSNPEISAQLIRSWLRGEEIDE